MKFKKMILCLLALSMLLCSCGLRQNIEVDGVEYEKHVASRENVFYNVSCVGFDYTGSGPIYILDNIDGIPVIGVGIKPLIGDRFINVYSNVERAYFPWTISDSQNGIFDYRPGPNCIISASVSTLIDTDQRKTFVIPNYLYNKVYGKYDESYEKAGNIIPANVAFLFNYEAAPNKGYFFVDLVEETGKLTKPPYDPKRVGYEFRGWYKDPGCEEEWDFENDVVEIKYDENGNRIYEEIFLYAWWYRMF